MKEFEDVQFLDVDFVRYFRRVVTVRITDNHAGEYVRDDTGNVMQPVDIVRQCNSTMVNLPVAAPSPELPISILDIFEYSTVDTSSYLFDSYSILRFILDCHFSTK